MTTWTEQTADSVTYGISPGDTTWDDGETVWDVFGAVASTVWDRSAVAWTDASDTDTTWTEA